MLWLWWRRLAWRLFGSPTVVLTFDKDFGIARTRIVPVEMVCGVPLVRLNSGKDVILLERGGKVCMSDHGSWQPLIGRVF